MSETNGTILNTLDTNTQTEGMSSRDNEEEERRQLKKIKFLGLNPTKFKITYADLLKEDPSLMRGLRKSGVWKKKKK